MHDFESKQEMLNILAIAVRQIIHSYIHNLKQMSYIDSQQDYFPTKC